MGRLFRSHSIERWSGAVLVTMLITVTACEKRRTVERTVAARPPSEALDAELREESRRPHASRISSSDVVPNWRPEHMLNGPPESVSLAWEFLGPMPIGGQNFDGPEDFSGRIASIAVHPIDPDTAYIAAASGGVWKTIDGGQQWIPLTDELPTLNHGCVALDPNDPEVVYVGTGEYLTGLLGDGLFRSPDGGATWDRLATAIEVGTTCSRIMVDPVDPLRIHVTGNIGYVRTDDGGQTWITHLAGDATDMRIHPNDASLLYVGHRPDGIYRSTDGGDTWTLLGGGLPNIETGNVVLGLAQSNPSLLYAAISEQDVFVGLQGVYRSTDGGNTWSKTIGDDPAVGITSWNLALAIDPADETAVYLIGFNPFRSQDSGASWQRVANSTGLDFVHADSQAITFGPDGTIWLGTDGGMWKSINGGQNWINLNGTLGITQFYALSIHPTDPFRFMAGSQDNGLFERTAASGTKWNVWIPGDGGRPAFDSVTPSIRYGSLHSQNFVVRIIGNAFYEDISGPWQNEFQSGNTPLVAVASELHTLLWGTTRVWRTQDANAGAQWTPLSSPLGSGSITAITVDQAAPNTIYAGTNRGIVCTTTDAQVWTSHDLGVGFRWVTAIDLDPNDSSRACVVSAGIRCTQDRGATWDVMTGNLPGTVGVRSLAVDWRPAQPVLYAGTGVGIYASSDSGATWQKDGTGFPNVIVYDVVIDRSNNTLIAGTHGRGAWRAPLPSVTCGDGVVDPDESCDTAIPPGGPGACPIACDSADACVTATLLNPGTCQAQCDFVAVTDPISGDGCCPPGATPAMDNDCVTIPTVSAWGLTVLIILMLSAGTVILRGGRRSRPSYARARALG